jgi:hypothetical protein
MAEAVGRAGVAPVREQACFPRFAVFAFMDLQAFGLGLAAAHAEFLAAGGVLRAEITPVVDDFRIPRARYESSCTSTPALRAAAARLRNSLSGMPLRASL